MSLGSWFGQLLSIDSHIARQGEETGKKRKRLETMNHSEIVSFIRGGADLIRDVFKRGKFQDVILPLTVLRRLDSVLEPTK